MTVTLRLRFPARAYHATPWGQHVNEGAIEWPPSPWRLLRGLTAVGYTHFAWREVPPVARVLFEALASVLPTFALPAATATHTRHYMPGAGSSRPRVLDAFAHVGEGVLWVRWNVAVPDEARVLLASLVQQLAYLGRAESRVEASLVDAASADAHARWNARPYADGEPVPAGGEIVTLLAPVTAAEYLAWREPVLAEARVALGAKPSAKKRAEAEGAIPRDLVEALACDTSRLQASGWSQAPGCRTVRYVRSREALAVRPMAPAPVPRTTREADTYLLALTSDTVRGTLLPTLYRTLPLAEMVHRGLVQKSDGHDGEMLPAEITGKDPLGKRLGGAHAHVHVLPVSIDVPGRVDHVLLHAPMGFGERARHAIERLRRTYAKGIEALDVRIAGEGAKGDFGALLGASVFGPAARWESDTPFVPALHVRRPKYTVEAQVHRELERRNFPTPRAVRVFGRDEAESARFHHYVRRRQDEHRAPPDGRGYFVQIDFDQEITGPICLGYASHFGLGRFAPVGVRKP